MTIREAQKEAWTTAEEKGFHSGRTGQGRDDTMFRLCLVHTEISEAAQEVKRHWDGPLTDQQKTRFVEELADACIRLFDLAECVGVDLQDQIAATMARNRERPMNYNTPFEKKGGTDPPPTDYGRMTIAESVDKIPPCSLICSECPAKGHHWMLDFDGMDDGTEEEGVAVSCKHCTARIITDIDDPHLPDI